MTKSDRNSCRKEKRCVLKCCKKIGIILQEELKAEKDMMLNMVNKLYPTCELNFVTVERITEENLDHLDHAVKIVENAVIKMKHEGIEDIILPSDDILLEPFITGTAGCLKNATIMRRHPDICFYVYGNDAPSIADAYNVFRFFDINTTIKLQEKKSISKLSGNGTILLIYQQGENYPEQEKERIKQLAINNNKIIKLVPVIYDGNEFTANSMDLAKQDIDSLVDGSIVLHLPNRGNIIGLKYETAAVLANFFTNSNKITHVGISWNPQTVDKVNAEIYINTRVTIIKNIEPGINGILSHPRWGGYSEYYDIIAYIATCGKYRGENNDLKFDNSGTRIFKLIVDFVYPPLKIVRETRNIRINPRWLDEYADPTLPLSDKP